MPDSLPTRAATSLRLRMLDAADVVARRRDPLVPPRRLRFVGEGDFAAVGDEYLRHLISLGKLGPEERVLDVGCGIGRLARPLSDYLGPGSSYDGFDPDPRGIEWCTQAYRNRPDFTFQHLDVFNGRYNPRGALDPRTVRFPYDDERFDVVVMVSVLTHVLPETLEHYLREARRVLLPDGRLFATAFLLDDSAREALAAGNGALGFEPVDARHAVVDPAVPEEAVAYDEEWFLDRVAEAGFRKAGIRHGTWTPRASGRAFQDIVVARLAGS
ncbi:MAG TPA: methyltransferase domain-containing protein [Solirubrobacteraceae bacterium]|nr:methyltransferase domain-containing protein [Solirubrobacteraceae bacterium]